MKQRLITLKSSGFTIVELIIVITVIGVLATIVSVAYNGVQSSARDSSLLSDIDALDAIQTRYGLKNGVVGKAWYSESASDSDINFTPSSGNIIDIVVDATDYCIRAYNLAGTKNSILNSATKESSPGACARIPASAVAGGVVSGASDLVVTSINSTSVGVTWSSAYGASSYRLEYALDNIFTSPTVINSLTGTATTVTGLTPGQVYYFRLFAITSGNAGPASTTESVTVPPDVPSGLAAVTNSSTSITSSWAAASGAASYNLEYSTSITFTSPVTITGIATLNTTISSLLQGRTYYFRVYGLSGSAISSASVGANSTTTVNAPSTPSSISLVLGSVNRAYSAGFWLYYDPPLSGSAPYASGTAATVTCASGTTANYSLAANYNSPTTIYGYSAWTTYTTWYIAKPYSGYSVRFFAKARCTGAQAVSAESSVFQSGYITAP